MAEALWGQDEFVRAANGTCDGSFEAPIAGLSIDTRSLVPGDVFVALEDQRDGHAFVPAAFAAGAAAALVRANYARRPGDGALIRVDAPLKALERVAAAARRRLSPDARVIAVTGSAGKTGTKEMLRACLATAGRTHAPEKSFNNHWGVPLTLARMPADTKFAVIEIGMNHADEIRPLARLANAHIAVITNVLPVHVGNFPDGIAGVARAKAEIFDGLVPAGLAVIPADSEHSALLRAAAGTADARVVVFGSVAGADARATSLEPDGDGTRVTMEIGGREIVFRLGAPGRHLAQNALAVAAVLDALELPLGAALVPLAAIRPAPGRGERHRLVAGSGTLLLIDESYNANPASVRAALAGLAGARQAGAVRCIAVLGDMLELGADAAAYHTGLADAVAAADLVFACGPNMRLLYDRVEPARQGGWAPGSVDLIDPVVASLQGGDAVMVKGSLGMRMAPIVEAIKKRFAVGRDRS